MHLLLATCYLFWFSVVNATQNAHFMFSFNAQNMRHITLICTAGTRRNKCIWTMHTAHGYMIYIVHTTTVIIYFYFMSIFRFHFFFFILFRLFINSIKTCIGNQNLTEFVRAHSVLHWSCFPFFLHSN